jgi:hypothetical protein
LKLVEVLPYSVPWLFPVLYQLESVELIGYNIDSDAPAAGAESAADVDQQVQERDSNADGVAAAVVAQQRQVQVLDASGAVREPGQGLDGTAVVVQIAAEKQHCHNTVEILPVDGYVDIVAAV